MKDILDYPENTPGSSVKEEFLDLHEQRGTKVLETFGGCDGWLKYCKENSNDLGVSEFKRRFEEIHNVKYPHNIKFEF